MKEDVKRFEPSVFNNMPHWHVRSHKKPKHEIDKAIFISEDRKNIIRHAAAKAAVTDTAPLSFCQKQNWQDRFGEIDC